MMQSSETDGAREKPLEKRRFCKGLNKGFDLSILGETRTHNLWLRRPALYPIELRGQRDVKRSSPHNSSYYPCVTCICQVPQGVLKACKIRGRHFTVASIKTGTRSRKRVPIREDTQRRGTAYRRCHQGRTVRSENAKRVLRFRPKDEETITLQLQPEGMAGGITDGGDQRGFIRPIMRSRAMSILSGVS